VLSLEDRDKVRAAARTYEQALPATRRKQLGQFFSGLRLGKLLAHLALTPDARTVLDPMAGHGDLLDAVWESAAERGIQLYRLDGLEIDEDTASTCKTRLAAMTSGSALLRQHIVATDAFDPAWIVTRPRAGYDLVITNPPYVRYQARRAGASSEDKIRSGLIRIGRDLMTRAELQIWEPLVLGYSGLADLSVPAWLLSAAMVKPDGHLALVVPVTWRSRDYADVIRYLMLRCFRLEFIVEDKQPGWFSDALIRTHLIVAQKLTPEQAEVPLGLRVQLPSARWLQVAPEAGSCDSLVGTTFSGAQPDAQFAARLRSGSSSDMPGITVRGFGLAEEWASLLPRVSRKRWFHQLEQGADALPLFAPGRSRGGPIIPDALRDILPTNFSAERLLSLEDAGIQVGQGLRTGCNLFFYVTVRSDSGGGLVRVCASTLFDGHEFVVPAGVLQPVLRRQSELRTFEAGEDPGGRVLDLRRWALPEDLQFALEATKAYAACGEVPPQTMPPELADYVRRAAEIHLRGTHCGNRIPQLSAVRTNVRAARNDRVSPRFWYMLPDFAPRHLPAAFVARVNSGLPWVECNRAPPFLIDANFSTFWSENDEWSPHMLKALLNSVWCRTFMEAAGTPMGGGALKLEATHLRRLPLPPISSALRVVLNETGERLTRGAMDVQSRIDSVVVEAVAAVTGSPVSHLLRVMTTGAHSLSVARQRAA